MCVRVSGLNEHVMEGKTLDGECLFDRLENDQRYRCRRAVLSQSSCVDNYGYGDFVYCADKNKLNKSSASVTVATKECRCGGPKTPFCFLALGCNSLDCDVNAPQGCSRSSRPVICTKPGRTLEADR